jgi:quercetin dioxygenase-like cupin family protein
MKLASRLAALAASFATPYRGASAAKAPARQRMHKSLGTCLKGLNVTNAYVRTSALAAALLVLAATAPTTPAQQPAVQLTPDQLVWQPYMAGGQQALLVGDPSRPGTYAVRYRFPAGLRIPPHTHPDARIVTVLAGTMYFAFGEVFDSSRVRAFPAGSVWTESPGQPHFAWARSGEVVLQVVGTGPTGMTLVQPHQ